MYYLKDKNMNENNQNFGIAGIVDFFEFKNSITAIRVTNDFATSIISLYGGHVISFVPKNQKDLLWMSDNSFYELGKPMRGGIPVCFPWFGPHPTDATLPLHGFLRLNEWTVEAAQQLPSGDTKIILCFKSTDETLKIWKHHFIAKLIVIVGATLDVTLKIENTGNEPFSYTDALHTYFNLSDITKVSIHGLEGVNYIDKLNKDSDCKQEESSLVISKEENRIYYNTSSDCVIKDSLRNRQIRVSKRGSKITLVWNPWMETAKKMPDFVDNAYNNMVCIEAVNTYNDLICLNPNEQFSLSAIISLV